VPGVGATLHTIEAVNIVTAGVAVTWALHVCYGNRYARPLWEGHYDFLFPAVTSARVDALVLEFARKGLDDLRLLKEHAWDRYLGLGVIDVKLPAWRTPTWWPRTSAGHWRSFRRSG
jgi:5-methyltetrahydropteroyltriglutamate--homocysteine methyltransferase